MIRAFRRRETQGERMPAYFSIGRRPKAEDLVSETDQCRKCLPILATRTITDLVYDTEPDARTTCDAFGQVLLNRNVASMWARLWNDFKCKGAACPRKQACGNAPTFVEIGSLAVVVDKVPRWQVYVTIVREIQCVADGGGKDVKVKVPDHVPSDAKDKHPEPKLPKPGDIKPIPWDPQRVQKVRVRDLVEEPQPEPQRRTPRRR